MSTDTMPMTPAITGPRHERRRAARESAPAGYSHGSASASLVAMMREKGELKVDLPTHDSSGAKFYMIPIPLRRYQPPADPVLPGQRRGVPNTSHRHGKGRSINRCR